MVRSIENIMVLICQRFSMKIDDAFAVGQNKV